MLVRNCEGRPTDSGGGARESRRHACDEKVSRACRYMKARRRYRNRKKYRDADEQSDGARSGR